MKCTPVSEVAGQLLLRNVCPNCHYRGGLLPGPRGGLSQNRVCPECYNEFNVGPIAGMCESFGVATSERMRDVYGYTVVVAASAGTTSTDAKPLDPVCRQGCQSLVFKGRIGQLETALRELDLRVHSGYDFNADPDGMTLLVGNALRGEP